jgi:hypothetical protein
MNTPASSKGTLPGTTYPEVPRKPIDTVITSDWRLLAWEPATNKVWSLIQQELVGALGGASYRTVRRSLFLTEYASGKLVAGRFSRITNRTGTRPTSDVLLFELDKRKTGLALEIQADEKDADGNVTAEGAVNMVIYTPANDAIKEVSSLTADSLLAILDAAGSNVNFAVLNNKLRINAKKYTGELGIEVSEAGKISLQKASPDYPLPPNPTVGRIATEDYEGVDSNGNPYTFKRGDVVTLDFYGQPVNYLVSDFIPIEPNSILTWPHGITQYSMYYDADKAPIWEVGRYVYDHPGTPDDTTPPNAAFVRVSCGDFQDDSQAQIIYDSTTYSFGNLPYVRLVNGYAPDANGNVYTDYIPGAAYGLEYWQGDYRLEQSTQNKGMGEQGPGYLNRAGLPEGYYSYDPQSPYAVSPYVQIEPGVAITWANDKRPKVGYYYDSNTNMIVGIAQYKVDTGGDLAPPNAYFMRAQGWRIDRDNPTPDKPADEEYLNNYSYTRAALPYVKTINGKYPDYKGNVTLPNAQPGNSSLLFVELGREIGGFQQLPQSTFTEIPLPLVLSGVVGMNNNGRVIIQVSGRYSVSCSGQFLSSAPGKYSQITIQRLRAGEIAWVDVLTGYVTAASSGYAGASSSKPVSLIAGDVLRYMAYTEDAAGQIVYEYSSTRPYLVLQQLS